MAVAFDLLRLLADGPRRSAELRTALGISSVNFFTARYLTPLAKSGYIAVAGGEKNRHLPGKQYRILRKGKAVVRAQPHHFNPTIGVRPSESPTGVSADASKRHAYVRWAHRRDGILIEDDFESEFARAPSGAETLFALDGGRRVIYLNTFSKTIAPSLRIGYMVLPKELLTLYARKVGFYSCTVPVFDQLFLADLIDSGDFERHLNRLRRRLAIDLGPHRSLS